MPGKFDDKYYRTRILKISDDDFWGSLRKGVPGLSLPSPRRASAEEKYRALAKYHGQELASELEYIETEVGKRLAGADAVKQCRTRAAQVLRHEIRGWHSYTRKFGKTIDFNADFGRSGQYGFHYLGWLQPVVDLYILTGKPRYRNCLLDVVRQYYDQRIGIRRRTPSQCPIYYELGARAKTSVLLPAYLALASRCELAGSDIKRFMKLFLGFSRSLLRLQKTEFRHGNWQIVGVCALFRLARTFQEFREAERWRKTALAIQVEHARKDFFSDGGHYERCAGYGWMSLRGVIETYRLGLRLGGMDQRSARTLRRCIMRGFRWFAHIAIPATPGLVFPAFGDGDLSICEEVFAQAGEFFPPDPPSSNRLLGVDRSASVILRPSGYAVMRDSAGTEGRYLNINFGRWGGWHTHSNLLDINIWAFGEPLIEEVGRFDSYDNPLNPFFRSARAHNQVEIEDRVMDRQSATGKNVQWVSNDIYDFFSATHQAYPGVEIRRNILFIKGVGFVVYDLISATEYIFVACLHLHSPRPFKILRNGEAVTEGRPGCRVVCAEPDEISHFETAVDIAPKDVTVPRLYTPRYGLRVRKWRNVQDHRPITFATAFYPYRSKVSSVTFKRRKRARSGSQEDGKFILRTPEGTWGISFGPQPGSPAAWTATVRRVRH